MLARLSPATSSDLPMELDWAEMKRVIAFFSDEQGTEDDACDDVIHAGEVLPYWLSNVINEWQELHHLVTAFQIHSPLHPMPSPTNLNF